MRDMDSEEVSEGGVVRTGPVTKKVNWIPTVVALGLFFWWIVLAFFFYGRFPDLRDAARSLAYVLFALTVAFAAPALAQQFAPKAPVGARRTAVGIIYLVVAVPLVFALFWSSYDALTPVHARQTGELPDIGSIIGRNEHDVVRILGAYKVVDSGALSPGEVSDATRPGGGKAQRFVVYSLLDMNTIDQRPAKQASRQIEAQLPVVQLGSGVDPEKWHSDALVVVYYGADSMAVGVRTDMSVRAVLGAISSDASQSVLAASGITPKAAISMASSAVSDEASDTSLTPAPIDAFWGSGTVNDSVVGYELQVGGLANFLMPRDKMPDQVRNDQGDVTLVVAPNLVGPTDMVVANASAAPAAPGTPSDALPQSDQTLVRRGGSSFSDRTFWVILCSKPFGSEEEAQQRAKQLNAQRGKNGPAFSVERSGHLEGLGNSDFWIVIYDRGYMQERDAHKVVAANPLGFPLGDVKVVQITKDCGEFTLSDVVQ